MRFLRSVDCAQLPPTGISFTLTVADVPDFETWKKLLRQLRRWLTRHDVHCWHWVVEWTRNRRPHLHGVFFSFDPPAPRALVKFWLAATKRFGTDRRAQHEVEITDAAGWFQYVSKHASRGFKHYQRDRDNIPPGWQKTGRMWGRSKDGWVCKSDRLQITREEFFVLRRMADRYAWAAARADFIKGRKFGNRKQELQGRASMAFISLNRKSFGRGRNASETRGLNEWMSQELTDQLLGLLDSVPSRWSTTIEGECLVFSNGRFNIPVRPPADRLSVAD